MPSFWTNIEPVLLILAPILIPLFVSWLVVLVKTAFEHMPTSMQNILRAAANSAVLAVEQSYPNYTSEEKKAKAEELISAELDHLGVKVPPVVISTLIESEVKVMNIATKPAIKIAPPMITKQGASA